jgi:hypothetical protein
MCISHRHQCKIKSKINKVLIKILKIPTVDNFHLINSAKWYHVYKNPTIHILDMKYDNYGSNTLRSLHADFLTFAYSAFFAGSDYVLIFHIKDQFTLLGEGPNGLYTVASNNVVFNLFSFPECNITSGFFLLRCEF